MTYINLDNETVKILDGGQFIDNFGAINLIEGSNVTLTFTPNPDANRLDLTIAATGGGGSGLTHGEVMTRVSLGF